MKDSRPPAERRCFTSPAIEKAITTVAGRMTDRELAWLFANCFPNTLDTTVRRRGNETHVITGDIDAMWLRDSTAQVWPYLPFANEDPALRDLIAGVIRRQAACVLLDPYANGFYDDPTQLGEWQSDQTEMKPGVHERKYELDSLCAVLRLACGYVKTTGDTTPINRQALDLIVRTIRVEQSGSSPYRFARMASRATDTLPLDGGNAFPGKNCGMSRSAFRPSDDACQLPFLIPANAMAVVCLRETARLLNLHGAAALAEEIEAGIRRHGIHDGVFAFEVDGFGSRVMMDDANVPSLLSLPYLGYCAKDDPLYQRTRARVLSPDNPYYSEGRVGRGIGGPHIGPGWIWPMAIIMQALTSDSDDEIQDCLRQLKQTHAGTGFMHESFWKDDATKFTRSWFAWANTLFGELILTLRRERPHLL